MLRAVRFASRLGFKMDFVTFGAIRTLAPKVNLLSKERVKDELFKMADNTGEKFAETLQLLDKCRLLEVVLPEVKNLQLVQEEPRFHPEAYLNGNGTTFDHVMESLKQNKEKDFMVNLSVLFHDLGKAVTHELDKGRYDDFRHRFHGHGDEGVKLLEEMSTRLKFSSYEKDVFSFCAKNHMVLFHCRKMKKSTAAKYVNHEHFEILKKVMYCDDSCRGSSFNKEKFDHNMSSLDNLNKELKKFAEKNKTKLVDGKTVMELTGLKPGKKVGLVIEEVTKRFLDSDNFVCMRKLIKDVAKEL